MAKTVPPEYDFHVFINCPFDNQYLELFRALIFTVHDCGYIARCAWERNDAGQTRVSKILKIISECRVGIHDLSRTELDPDTKLPRFNMPLELGMFLGAREYGTGEQRDKICLVLDRDRFRFQKFCSDIAGQDIYAHSEKIDVAVRVVRDFLRNAQRARKIPGHATIFQRYLTFLAELPTSCSVAKLDHTDLIFDDYVMLVEEWIKVNAMP